MMKLLTVLFFFISFISWTQEDDELVLYRGIENRVYLKDLSENERVIVNDSSILVKQINDSIYLTIPALFPLNTLRLQVMNEYTKAIKMEQEVPVVFIPDPDLYIISNNCKACMSSLYLVAKSEILPESYCHFEILFYTLHINNRKAKGRGNTINVGCTSMMKQASFGDVFVFTAKVKGPDGIIREVKGQFKIT